MDVFGLIQVRDEARYLPGFLHHLAPHVDGIVALDDCSSDATLDILRAEPKVLSILRERRAGPPHAHEVENRHRLMLEASRLGARWVLCGDADERFEARFLRRLHREAERGEARDQPLRFVRLVNLWNSPDHYRVDGRTGPRWTCRMFRLPSTITRRPPSLHQPWFPPELDGAKRGYVPAHLYHLKMIDREDREARFRKFATIDPDLQHQPIGYGHLVDEEGLEVRPVLPFRHYVDLPPDAAPSPAIPALADGSLADPDFRRRFHIDATSARPAETDRRGRRLIHGFDFDAIFAGLRAARS